MALEYTNPALQGMAFKKKKKKNPGEDYIRCLQAMLTVIQRHIWAQETHTQKGAPYSSTCVKSWKRLQTLISSEPHTSSPVTRETHPENPSERKNSETAKKNKEIEGTDENLWKNGINTSKSNGMWAPS